MSDMYNKEQKDTHTHKKIMTINSEIKIQYNTHRVYINEVNKLRTIKRVCHCREDRYWKTAIKE